MLEEFFKIFVIILGSTFGLIAILMIVAGIYAAHLESKMNDWGKK